MTRYTLLILVAHITLICDAQSDTSALPALTIQDELLFQDDPIARVLDSLVYTQLFAGANDSLDRALLDFSGLPEDSILPYTSEEIRQRLEILDQGSPMAFDHNRQVENYISAYLGRNRWTSTRVLGLSYTYFPLFEEIFDKHGIPYEMKYLAVVESALNPSVKSHMGAAGLWQFMVGTGREQGLKITSFVDERMDPIKSTEAACMYLNRLYRIYGDWNLVLAAYNSGPGNVNKAIRRSGSRDYWELRQFLPRETRGYVPAFIAVAYIMNFGREHNLYPLRPAYTHYDCDTLCVDYRVSFDRVAKETGMDAASVQWLNPQYQRGIIPQDGRTHVLRLPYDQIGNYLANEEKIKSNTFKQRDPEINVVVASKKSTPKPKTPTSKMITYTVKGGDVLGVIAQNHNVGLSDLKSWNNLRSNTIKPGQKLKIYPGKAEKVEPKKNNPQGDYHTVQRGDSFWEIAKLYDDVSIKDIKVLNKGVSSSRLKLGQKIRIR